MIYYNIKYTTQNRYDDIVLEGLFDFLILPCNDMRQHLDDYYFDINRKHSRVSYNNLFGFEVNRLRTTRPFQDIEVALECTVSLDDTPPAYVSKYGLTEELIYLNNFEFQIDQYMFLKQTPLTEISKPVKQHFVKVEDFDSLFEFIQALSSQLYKEISYEPNATDIHTTAADIAKRKTGVCQDFAQLMIGICREYGIPARYVSGYLHQEANLKGAAYMHAWVECFVPGVGWCGFDPSNNLAIDHHYIKVAHGMDYEDCGSLRGVLKTNGDNSTEHSVQVEQVQ